MSYSRQAKDSSVGEHHVAVLPVHYTAHEAGTLPVGHFHTK